MAFLIVRVSGEAEDNYYPMLIDIIGTKRIVALYQSLGKSIEKENNSTKLALAETSNITKDKSRNKEKVLNFEQLSFW